jgi:hypothetical protein
MDARNLIPNRDGEPELEPIAAGNSVPETAQPFWAQSYTEKNSQVPNESDCV